MKILNLYVFLNLIFNIGLANAGVREVSVSLTNNTTSGLFKLENLKADYERSGTFSFLSTSIHLPFCGNFKTHYESIGDLIPKVDRVPLTKSYRYKIELQENNTLLISYDRFEMSAGTCGFRMVPLTYEVPYVWTEEGKEKFESKLRLEFSDKPRNNQVKLSADENSCSIKETNEIECMISKKNLERARTDSYYRNYELGKYYFNSESLSKKNLETIINEGLKLNFIITE